MLATLPMLWENGTSVSAIRSSCPQVGGLTIILGSGLVLRITSSIPEMGSMISADVVRVDNRTYSTDLYADEAARIITKHRRSAGPLFLYLAFQSVHTPLQVPAEYQSLYKNVHSKKRKTFLGMVTAMDDAVGRVMKSLKENNMFSDSIIVFMSDNGGPTDQGADNYPLRGSKGSLWEGGTRTPAFITWSSLKRGKESRVWHITDWLPSLLDMAGITSNQRNSLDGVSHWGCLSSSVHNSTCWKRKEMVYNVFHKKRAAIRKDQWKYILPQKKLFDLSADPLEDRDRSAENPLVVKELKRRIDKLARGLSRQKFPQKRSKGQARTSDGVWTYGWC